MGTRRKSRELALQMLFQSDMGKQTADQVRSTFWAEHGAASAASNPLFPIFNPARSMACSRFSQVSTPKA